MKKTGKILLAESSKVIRSSVGRYLADHYEVREESSGESAWQSSVLDHSIVAVVSGQNLLRLDGLGLLQRLRESKLPRLKYLPFFLVVPQSITEDEKAKALAAGATGFVIREAAAKSIEQMLQALNKHSGETWAGFASLSSGRQAMSGEDVGTQTEIRLADVVGRIDSAVADDEAEQADEARPCHEAVLLAKELIESRLNELLANPDKRSGVGVLTFGLEGYTDLARRFGSELALRTAQKLSFLLARKIRPEDSIALLADGRIVIVVPSTTRAVCQSFAARICEAMTSARVVAQGQPVDLAVSVGVAVMPEDGEMKTGGAMLNLSGRRMELARRAGKNRVIVDEISSGGSLMGMDLLEQLANFLAATDPKSRGACLGTLGVQIMPLLTELEAAFKFGLPLGEMRRRLVEAAQTEQCS